MACATLSVELTLIASLAALRLMRLIDCTSGCQVSSRSRLTTPRSFIPL
jgi:hypothetical protein